jgi:2,3-bisphosphoglycerate-dependent phosphoglycerate mutase
MKHILSIALVFVLVCPVFSQEQTITTFILVRHAEKASDGTDNPDLSADGAARAQRLLSLFKNSTIAGIYSTKYKRTQNTVAPIAKEKELAVVTYEKFDIAGLTELARKHSGGIVVIAGHSNTVPQIANALLGKNDFRNFPDTEYGTILMVSVVEAGKNASVVKLSY